MDIDINPNDIPLVSYIMIDGTLVQISGTIIDNVSNDYESLTSLPNIEGVTIKGSLSLEDIGAVSLEQYNELKDKLTEIQELLEAYPDPENIVTTEESYTYNFNQDDEE